MKKIILMALLISTQILFAQTTHQHTDANIIGDVQSEGEHLPFVNISVQGTTIGTVTDETGHFQLIHMPVGEYTVVASHIGYKSQAVTITNELDTTKEIKFELEPDVLGLDEVVITGDRNTRKRKESLVIVDVLSPRKFNSTQSLTISEGLNFTPGVRVENDCQNCGFTQVRMNGMEGPYSQILVNNRPIFSGLAGVYGLELIPSNMIEKIEVVRGSGSALYGSNAIAGTINLILKDPLINNYEVGFSTGSTGVGVDGSGDAAPDYTVNFNTSIVGSDSKSGMSLYGFHRVRDNFDANGDEFSELSAIDNTTLGSRLFYRPGLRNKLTLDLFNIKEERRGGNKFELPLHETDISEALNHSITTGTLVYEQYFRENDLLSAYASMQKVDRDSYYGAEQSLSDYGRTEDISYNYGLQYKYELGKSTLTGGAEITGGNLVDEKLGYFDVENDVHTGNTTVADQTSTVYGAFVQYDRKISNLTFSLGGRFDNYTVSDEEHEGEEKSGNVIIPRVNLLYDFTSDIQGRLSYSQGYRAPQIFDEDLHIETSGSRQVLHINDPDLTQETSHSYTASVDVNKQVGKAFVGFLVAGFYTSLVDPFVNEFGEADENGVVEYLRVNAEDGASVKGVNIELNVVASRNLNLNGGLTIQNSEYAVEQEFDEKKFFRTPDSYGYAVVNWKPAEKLQLSLSGNYTGKMLVPYFGLEIADPDAGELRESDPFFDLGAKFSYNIKLIGSTLQLIGGVKNILNSYQDDFDSGIDRDPAYIYGPGAPRTIYVGVKIGNMLN